MAKIRLFNRTARNLPGGAVVKGVGSVCGRSGPRSLYLNNIVKFEIIRLAYIFDDRESFEIVQLAHRFDNRDFAAGLTGLRFVTFKGVKTETLTRKRYVNSTAVKGGNSRRQSPNSEPAGVLRCRE